MEQISFPDRIINYFDIAKGVGEVIVDEAKLALHAVCDHFRHEGLSEHFNEPQVPENAPDEVE